MLPLVVCASCRRHVRLGEAVCPFCAKDVPASLTPVPLGPRRPYLGKGATALALTLATAAACKSSMTVAPDTPASPSKIDAGPEVSMLDASSTDTADAPPDVAVQDTAKPKTPPPVEHSDAASIVPMYK